MVDSQASITALINTVQNLTPDTAPAGLVRLAEPFPAVDLLAWLKVKTELCRIYWRDRDGDREVAGVGQASLYTPEPTAFGSALSEMHKLLGQTKTPLEGYLEPRFYGGVGFDSEAPRWSGFGYARWVLPQLELIRSRRGCWLTVNLLREDFKVQQAEVLRLLRALEQEAVTRPLPPITQVPLSCHHQPDRAAWIALVQKALASEAKGELAKVVLSRESCLDFAEPVCPWQLLSSWQHASPHSYRFLFQFDGKSSFVGCSPERLFKRIDRMLLTEALAGTSIRGRTVQEDRQREQALLNDQKNIRENAVVLQHIQDQLSPLTTSLTLDGGLGVLKLKRVQHLRYRIRAVLAPKVTEANLVAALHPTPAVGGHPTAAAMAWIRAREPYDRGWYAGACGCIGGKISDFSVGIRSARVEGRQLRLYAGAGIVPGSDPLCEWQELNNKMDPALGLFERASACA